MDKVKAKRVVQGLLGKFGLQLERARLGTFEMQKSLIAVESPVIFDVGAHIGETARTYRQYFPTASIYCFEPFPDSFQKLTRSVAADSRVFCNNVALSNTIGKATLNSNSSAATNSLLNTDQNGSHFWGEGLLDTTARVEIDTTTVDAFTRGLGLSRIDILKMDVQGAEYSVLEGAREMLSTKGISLIYTELIMCPTYEGQRKFHEYLSLLDSFGYDFVDLFNPVRRHGQLIQADIVFLNSSLKPS